MSTEPVTTTGTEPKDGGKALEQPATPGTPAADNGNAKPGESIENLKALAISLQEKARRVNELEARLKELESGAPSPAATPDDATHRRQDRIARLEAAARAGDPAAEEALEAIYERDAMRREMNVELELARLPKDEEKKVREHIKKHPGRFNSIEVARNDLKGQELEAENQQLRQENERLKKKPDDDVTNAVPTVGRETTARGTNLYDQARWQNEMKALDQRINDGDRSALEEKVKLQAQRRAGKLPWRPD